jgi:hypothetical protein
MKKVWNITGMPGGPPARTLMLFGQSVRPGRYVKVDDDLLKNAHKTKKNEESGLVHVGDKLPKGYPGMLNVPRVAASPKRVDGHGKAALEAAAKTPLKAAKKVEVTEEVKVASKPVKLSTKKRGSDEKSGGK